MVSKHSSGHWFLTASSTKAIGLYGCWFAVSSLARAHRHLNIT